MTITELPTTIEVPARDELVEKYKRYYQVRKPDADVGDDSFPDVDARVLADMVFPLYGIARTIPKNMVIGEATGPALTRQGEIFGVPKPTAQGSVGFVQVKAATGGTSIQEDDELRHPQTQMKFRCARGDTYANDAYVPIQALSSGTSTNLAAGTVLEWTSPRPGCQQKCTIVEDSDGNGLTGGREEGTEDEHQDAILDKMANPEASGNAAQYIAEVRRTPGIAVEAVVAYPAILGPGKICIAFTVPRSGNSRIPSSAQIAEVRQHLTSIFPEDDGIMMADIVAQPVDLDIKVKWQKGAVGWIDAVPWPKWYSGTSADVYVSTVTSATAFTLARVAGYASPFVAPTVGTHIAFYDKTNRAFVKKKILSITGTGPYAIVVDTTLGVSDETYTPAVNQRCCPWSDSLAAIAVKMNELFDSLGPGEQVATIPEDGVRMGRVPVSPSSWPHTLTERMIENATELPEVLDRGFGEASATTPTVGTPGVLSYMLTLNDLTVFAM